MTMARGVALGPYEILDRIGEGGMGEVWRARDHRIGRDVAVKVLSGPFGPDDDAVRRFEQEARAAGALNHPGLVTFGLAIGTPGYLSPEQARALPLDHRTDIFSLGSVLFEMLSGRPAFDFISARDIMNAIVDREPPPLMTFVPDIPPALDEIVRHCLEKNPQNRYQ